MEQIKKQLEHLGFSLNESGYNVFSYTKEYPYFKLYLRVGTKEIKEMYVKEIDQSDNKIGYFVPIKSRPSLDFIEQFDNLMNLK